MITSTMAKCQLQLHKINKNISFVIFPHMSHIFVSYSHNHPIYQRKLVLAEIGIELKILHMGKISS